MKKKKNTHKEKKKQKRGESLSFSYFPPGQLFACLSLSRLPHYLRAWNRLIGTPVQRFTKVVATTN